MKINVIGPGSMGIALSYFLHRRNEVVLTVKHGDRGFYDDGLVLIDNGKEEKFKVEVAERSVRADFTFVTTKSYDLESVFGEYDLRGNVVLMQNGLSHMKIESEGVTKIYAVTTWGAKKISKGVVELTGRGYFRVGSPEGRIDVSFMNDSGINAEWVDNIDEELYRKAAINAVINPITSLFGVKNGAITEDGELWSMASATITELDELFSRMGFHLEVERNVRETCRVTAKNTSSMLQDILQARRSEIDSITGEIISLGKKRGLEMRINGFLYDSIRYLEKHQRT